jgi:hypothetical protein
VCCAISVATPQWCADIVHGYGSNPQAQTLLTKLASDSTSSAPFSLSEVSLDTRLAYGWETIPFCSNG